MSNTVFSGCGNGAYNCRKTTGKSCVGLSTVYINRLTISTMRRAKALFMTTLIHPFTLSSSLSFLAFSPLIEYIFYPVSTAPTNTPTELKI